ncbi:hypothetical protein QTP70_023518 [Hemibagrus guttatus]|uniref:Uncharacterized protein n=1 Tax=Hemibagrus guttatus TaxID=175788 RepID=A0AAE0Q2W8_9TELE|nr:hypothetical protein QTP70_023518 [Hemibagrus guttatus]KAK3536708.1 hypothetical protein QTP86_022399 [Hemibagrus guttatus]
MELRRRQDVVRRSSAIFSTSYDRWSSAGTAAKHLNNNNNGVCGHRRS